MPVSLPPENLLASEASPYLRQHSGNPVHWRPWNPASLAEARSIGKPVLLSVGYAACHWCHVMAHESFENPEIAAVMNRLFVNIKVDREERPDIDQIFMAALSAMGEQGGWQLTMFLTPDAEPFWGGTYFPPTARYGRPGFVQVLEAVAIAWEEKRDSIRQSAQSLAGHVRGRLAASGGRAELSKDALHTLAANIRNLIDPHNGGLRGAPRFPNASFMQTLWLDWLERRETASRDAFVASYRHMLNGGIYDHLGGGLCRYSTDAEWMIPHFEKMLYDNAQLVRHATWAFAETGDDMFRQRIEDTIGWLLREALTEDGGLAASYDADSEGEEGKFYTWEPDELLGLLGDRAQVFLRYYGLGTAQTWEGNPVIYRKADPAAVAPADVEPLAAALQVLNDARDRRVRPGRDSKVLVDWNGLAIAALAEAGRTFRQPAWIDAAAGVYAAIMARRSDQGRLPHAFLGTSISAPALSSDYAAMISAAIALFEPTQDPRYLDDARNMAELLQAWHADPDGQGFFLTASDAEDVPMRIRGDVDEAIPSATGQVIEALAKLAAVTGDESLHALAWTAGEHAAARAAGQAYGQAGIVNANAVLLATRKLVIIDERQAPRLVPVANRMPDPRRVDIVLPLGAEPVVLADGSAPPTDRIAAYLCIGTRCLMPVTEASALENLLTEP